MAKGQKSLAALNDEIVLEMNVGVAENVVIQVTGTFVMTIEITASTDGTNFHAVQLQSIAGGAAVASITTPGTYLPVFNLYGATKARAKVTAFTSGSAVIAMSAPRH